MNRPGNLLTRHRFAVPVLTAIATLGWFAPSVPAQVGADDEDALPASREFAKADGEEEQIRRRLEWFYETRRAGTSSDDEMGRLRRLAAREVGRRLLEQKKARAAGAESTNVWFPVGPAPSHFGGWTFGDVSGRITAIARDSGRDILYTAGAAGGLWKSINDGLSWTPIFDTTETQTIGAIAVDPNDPDVLWAGTGDYTQGCEGYFGIGLLRSADGGLTWEPRNGSGGSSLEDMSTFASVVVDPRNSSRLVVGGQLRGCSSGSSTSGGIYTTEDAGLTWTKRLANAQVHEIAQDPANRDRWWAATGAGIYRSTDNAATWTLQTASGLPSGNTGRTELAIAPSNPQVVYALFAQAPSSPAFWRTIDGGASWTLMSSGSNACDGQCWYNMALRVHPTTPDVVYRGTIHIFKSTNGGTSWTDLSNNWGPSQKVHQDMHVLVTDAANPEWLYVGGDGGVWKSTDGGASFTNLNGNLELTQFYAVGVHPTDPGTVCGGAQDNSSLARPGFDNVWDLQAVTGDGFVCHIDPVNPNTAYITSYPGSYPAVSRSTNGVFGSFGGITGSGSGINGGDRINWVTPYLLDPLSPNILYLGTHRVYKSTDHGSSWKQVGPNDLTGGSGNILSLEINRNYTDALYAGTTSGRVWRSGDAGATWSDLTSGLPARAINDIGADPTNPDRAFAVVGGFGTAHLWEHVVGGGWTARGGGLPNVPANSVLLVSADDVFVATDVGVFRSGDGGATFAPFMSGLPQGLVVTDLKFHAPTNLLIAGTYGRGAWQVSLDPVAPIVVYDSVELPLIEVDGDGDGNPEPGETWQVRPLLRNAGGQTASDVSARLRAASPGVVIGDPDVRSYGDIGPGATDGPLEPYTFTVDTGFTCGDTITFDVVDIVSSNPPGSYRERLGAFTVTVVDHFEPDVVSTLLDETFDPAPSAGWSHDVVNPGIAGCSSQVYRDEWKLFSKDATHGQSYHCGNGPGLIYQTVNHAWLRYGGTDSANGPGLTIPADATSARMTLTHWWGTSAGQDGGHVAVDAVDDGQDVYTTITPEGGYSGTIWSGFCNGLQNEPAWSGSSGGWVTSTFDLSAWIGRTIYLAWVFGSDRVLNGSGEGWYIDHVNVESRTSGDPVCQVTRWPSEVGATARFERLGDGSIEASWPASCNAAEVPGQTYSVQAGDLAELRATGAYTHEPVAGACGLTSPATFVTGAGDEYFLVIPNVGGAREGGSGSASSGERPQSSAVCGGRHVEACP